MGSSSSKGAVASSSSSSSSSRAVRRTRSLRNRVLQSSCLGRSFRSLQCDKDGQVSNSQDKQSERLSNEMLCTTDQNGAESDQLKQEGTRKTKTQKQQNEVSYISSDIELDPVFGSVSGVDASSSRAGSDQSLIPLSHSRPRFSFVPGNMSFRLSRASSFGSSREDSIFSNDNAASDDLADRNGNYQGNGMLAGRGVNAVNHFHTLPSEDTSDVVSSDGALRGLSTHSQTNEIVSAQGMARSNENTGTSAVNAHCPREQSEVESIEARMHSRRNGAREPVERSVRFSRTLSVGRLRDRVLRRSSFSDGLFNRLQEDMEVRESSRGDTTITPVVVGNAESSPLSSSYPPSNPSNSMYSNQDYELESSRPREARYRDIMEHRTDFLERRRRIRSQVRALQRLGSRFENLSGHERSCILSGQHRTGRCTCRTSNHIRNPDDDSSARASISRIVLLAEALFEVLDEIHQQSVVLSTRPSVSSIGSVPAPKEVVESMPVKTYSKLHKDYSEDAAQCYICLVEYEEGDSMRILPCHHEFHRACVDKWLKEIHRVCPLCRGDICRSDALSIDT
ncbi:hypothetical protein Sjap_003997 [Stephania japonica]|uniref:RING-type domain-containing protein n=1 Tax=Stephania japonica TaxID=461633 RepID=A0AAP0K286_9MAGN